MMKDLILIRYGELALKGNNRGGFENRLLQNIRQKLAPFSGVSVSKSFGRIYVNPGDNPISPMMEAVSEVFGVVGISPAKRVEAEMQTILKAAVQLVKGQQRMPQTFKVVAKRANKAFPYNSQTINQKVGSEVLKEVAGIRVDVHDPELELRVEVRGKEAYLYGENIPGPGGLPVGTAGRVMLMLSGGIDSPVAGYLALKRGASLEAVHFHSYPFTSERSRQKVEDLTRLLTRFGGKIHLHVIPFTPIQTQIRERCKDSYQITIMRRMMVRIAERMAHIRNAPALVTGESLGQVASQTLESMSVINDVTRIPVLRPLVGMDKQEIMNIAKQIGTYETSILPYEDCCTVFQPKSPVTRPNLDLSRELESRLDMETLLEEAVHGAEQISFSPDQLKKEFSYF